jgi:hypothetical protein
MDKIDYKSRLKQLRDPDRGKDFIEKFGKDTYNKFYNYYSTKVFIEDNGLDQDTFAPSYRYIDDLITNYASYVKQYGKKGYNTYYSLVWENVKPEVDTLQKAAKIKSGGYFSADILNQATDLGNMYKYTDDDEDRIRQKLGLVPKAFDSAAKKIVKQAAEIRKQLAASDPNATEQSLLDKFSPSSGWDFLDDKPVTEKDVRDAISVILRQNAVSQYGDIYAGGRARRASNVPDRTGGMPTIKDNINRAQQQAEEVIGQIYDTRSGAVRGAMTDINYNEWQDLGKTSLPEGTKYDPKTGLIISSTVVPEGVDLMYNPEAAVAVQEVENLNDLITRLREKKASGKEVTDEELKPLADKGLTKIIDVIKNTTPENVAYHRPAGTQVASELEKTTQATKYHTKQAVAEAGYTAAMQSDPHAQRKIAQVSGAVDFSGDTRKRIVAMLNAADGAQADNPAANIANFASGGLASIDLIKYAYTTPEQRNVLRYLYSIGDMEGFDAYAEAISRELNRRKADDQKKTIDKTFGQSVGGKIGAGALAALSGLGAGVGWIESGINAIKGVPTDPYSTWQSPAYASDMLRETALEGASDVGKFFGNVGISLAQNAPLVAANIASGGAAAPVTLGVMGASAAGQATQQALQSGATSGEAFLSGAAAGAIEVLTEKLPLDNLVRIGQAAKSAGKGAVVKTILANMPKQAAIEAGEETVAEIANNLADYIIMGDRSQIEQYKQSLIDNGMSPDEAERQAFLRFYVANPALAGAGGAVSGAVFAGAGGAMGNIIGNLQQRAANIRTQAEAKALIDEIDALIPQADPEVAGQLTTIKQNLDQWGLEKSKQVVENAKQNADKWNDTATARLMNENRVNTGEIPQPAQNTPNVENAIPSAPASDDLFTDIPEVQTGRRGGISIPAIPDIPKAPVTPNTVIYKADVPQQAYQENDIIEYYQPLNQARYKAKASEAVAKMIEANPAMKQVQHLNAVKVRAVRWLSDADGNINYKQKAQEWVSKNAAKIESGEAVDTSVIVAGMTLVDMARNAGDTFIEENINALVSMAQSQYGSNLAILRWLNSNTSSGYERVLEHKFNGVFNWITKKYGRYKAEGVNRKGARVSDGIINKVRAIQQNAVIEAREMWKNGKPTPEQIAEFEAKLQMKIADALPMTLKDKLRALRFMQMLSAPLTGVTNFVANAIEVNLTWLDRQVAALEERISPIEKGNYQHTFGFRNFPKNSAEMQAIRQSSENAGRLHYLGNDKFDITSPMTAVYKDKRGRYQARTTFKQYNISEQKGAGKIGAAVKNIPSLYERGVRTLISDWVFWKYHYESALAQMMKARDVHTVTPDMERAAMETADRATYRLQNIITRGINRLRNKRGPIGRITMAVAPFSTAPVNLALAALNRSPYGFLGTIVRALAVENKNVRDAKAHVDVLEAKLRKASGKDAGLIQKQLDEAKQALHEEKQMVMVKTSNSLARNTTGLVITALGVLLSAMGLIVTRYSDNKEEREFAKAMGVREYSLRIPDGKGGYIYVPLDKFTTLALGLFTGAEIYNAAASSEGTDVLGRVVEGASSALQGSFETFSDLSMLQGITPVVEKVAKAARGEPNVNITEPFIDIAYNYYIGQMTPAFARAIGNIVNPDIVTTQSDSYLERKYYETLTKVGIKSAVPAAVDVWGNTTSLGLFGKNVPKEQQTFTDLMWRFAQNTFIPSKISTYTKDPVNTEILRLINSPEVKVKSKALPNVFNSTTIDNALAKKIDANGVKISPQELSELKQKAGQACYRVVKQVIKMSEYADMNDKDKAQALANIYEELWTAHKNELVRSKIPSVSRIGG